MTSNTPGDPPQCLIYALLYVALSGFVPAAIVFSAVPMPMPMADGVFVLLLRGIPFSITAAAGFIALSGVAVPNGLVMMSGSASAAWTERAMTT